MKKPKIIVYHNTILDKKVFIVIFIKQPLDINKAKEILNHYSSSKYVGKLTGRNAITFIERKENFDPQEKKRGWHIQYDQYDAEQSFVWSPDELYAFKDGEFWEKLFIERISGIGIRAED